ncbi:DUF1257 domain-containing protein [Leptolyngbya sp. NIES-2104]|uniref:DUF1257 domain-containing protein n=1 Tax=Leptolyngbya sp. NIES-2104 TaxID=1552121 RepID=UPI0006EC4958|nr:DUF1257 domain-containing protein [Leptolyngbya sp. NIES-2104]GAP99725.1 hypothetical protein NIES2104_62910 [Leptolyngbya sp. NIES-2104]
MSHFATITTQLNNREALIEGLKTLLIERGIIAEVEVHEQPVKLISDYDRRSQAEAEIIIRRHHLHTPQRKSQLDVGFRWDVRQNCFVLVADAWDFNQNALGFAFPRTQRQHRTLSPIEHFNEEVQFYHDEAVIQRDYPVHLWNREDVVLDDGSIETTLTQIVSISDATVSAAW